MKSCIHESLGVGLFDGKREARTRLAPCPQCSIDPKCVMVEH
jgi:hypothetical protein